MILQALNSYYHRLQDSGNNVVAPAGFRTEKIHFMLVLNTAGDLLQVVDLREVKGRKKVAREVIVPQGPKKSVNIAASFLWGSTSYVLGADDKGKAERTALCHAAFRALHDKLLHDHDDDGAKAILGFLSSWDPSTATDFPDWTDMLKANLAFRLDGDLKFIHERPGMRSVWLASFTSAQTGQSAMCLVSGKVSPVARLHPAIKSVSDAQPSGAALSSFNLEAFCSYGRTQNFNAPVSESAAAAYTKALNHLLSSRGNRVQIGDATTVFWTERDSPVEQFFGMVLSAQDTAGTDNELNVFLKSVRDGKLPHEIDGNVRLFILGLSPNASRLSVRFWHMSTVKDISEKLGEHFTDLSMVRAFDSDPEYPGMWHLLKETANRKSKDGPPPLLAGAVMRAILSGTPYPQALLSGVIGRIRAEQSINYMRAAILKAVLTRRKRILNQGTEVSMALDTGNKNVAYRLGRLFAVLEKAQKEAIPSANTTIKDRFYSSASATPRVVFPQLLRLAQHHIQKAEYGRARDRQIEEIIGDIREFPAHLPLDDQGLFAIGYYHQRQDFFRKHDKDATKSNKE